MTMDIRNERICLMGASGSGKDWITLHLVKRYNYIRLSFSDALKEIASNTFDWLKKDYSPDEKEKPLNVKTYTGELITLSPREIWLKMNFLRQIEDGLFVRKMKEELEKIEYEGFEHFVISDLRTKPELDFVKENGFSIIKIVNPNNYHPDNEFDKMQNSKEFVEAVVKTYHNEIGKEFTPKEFWI